MLRTRIHEDNGKATGVSFLMVDPNIVSRLDISCQMKLVSFIYLVVCFCLRYFWSHELNWTGMNFWFLDVVVTYGIFSEYEISNKYSSKLQALLGFLSR